MRICISLLDEIISQKLGFHFLEPITRFEEQLKIQAVLQKPPLKS